jgi:FMN phosphatase YigB (HAD superfamily)
LLIIFDLDDTIIDTSGAVTPFKLKSCLERFIREGLRVDHFENAYQELLQINASSIKSKDALTQFLKARGALHLLEGALAEMVLPMPESFQIPTTPNAKEILSYLAKKHTLALVTGGSPPFQMDKLEKAGIDRSVFSKIAIPEDSVKKPSFQGILKEFSSPPDQTWMCGDRIEMDLVPAFELGLKTVHMRWGRGQIGESEKWIHHVISDLGELKGIIDR